MGEARPPTRPLWRGDGPLVLASRSESRRALLSAAGLDASSVAPEVDERAVEDRYVAAGGALEGVALELARAKALAVSAERPDAYCIGADQTLTLEGRILHKSHNLAEAAKTLAALSGRTHRLTSAFCVARAGQALVVHRDHADLTDASPRYGRDFTLSRTRRAGGVVVCRRVSGRGSWNSSLRAHRRRSFRCSRTADAGSP